MGKVDPPPGGRSKGPKPPPARGSAKAGSRPRTNEQLEKELGDSRYPASAWPVRTVPEQVELLVRIAADVAAGRIGARDGYNERLRLAWRVYLYEMGQR